MKKSDKTIDQLASTHLGSGGTYAVKTDTFDPSLLVKMPRKEARDQWGINYDNFVGADVWRAYESTFLTDKGMPVSGTLKIVYSCKSEYMVESKSLKLYLNSFDMCKMGPTDTIAQNRYTTQVRRDLEELLDVNVVVSFFTESMLNDENYIDIFQSHSLIDSSMWGIEITDYEGKYLNELFTDETLTNIDYGSDFRKVEIYSNLLRSRCRHTHQKDSGSIYLTVRANKILCKESFLKEIISLREVNEFHEFCAEKVFQKIFYSDNKDLKIKDLMIACLYARRGGIDINPIRATSWDLIPEELLSEDILCKKKMLQ